LKTLAKQMARQDETRAASAFYQLDPIEPVRPMSAEEILAQFAGEQFQRTAERMEREGRDQPAAWRQHWALHQGSLSTPLRPSPQPAYYRQDNEPGLESPRAGIAEPGEAPDPRISSTVPPSQQSSSEEPARAVNQNEMSPEQIAARVQRIIDDGDGFIRMYRGIGDNVAEPGRRAFFSTDPNRAAAFGELHYVDVTVEELAKFERPHSERILRAEPIAINDWRTADLDFVARLRPVEIIEAERVDDRRALYAEQQQSHEAEASRVATAVHTPASADPVQEMTDARQARYSRWTGERIDEEPERPQERDRDTGTGGRGANRA
jgi:hypothetical protein